MPLHFITDFRQRLLMVCLLAVVITIPLTNTLNSIALILFVIASAVQRPPKESLRLLSRTTLWIFPAIYFLWMVCSYFWDVTGGYHTRDIERYAMLFFIPPALAVIPRFTPAQLRATCMTFVAAVCILCVICLYKSYAAFKTSGDWRLFYYHYLSMQMGLNAIFLSCYSLVSIFWLLYYTFLDKGRMSVLRVVLNIIICLFLFVMLFLLSSKFLIFLTLVSLIFIILYIGYYRKKPVLSAFIIVALIAAGIFATRNLGYLRWRISVTELQKYKGEEDNNNGLAIRMVMWESAWEMFRERPLLGYGVRGARKTILEKYREKNFMLGYEEGYHSHNQYLESAIMGGIPALLLLLATMGGALLKGIRSKNLLLLHILFIFITQSFIESAFEVQQELVFYIFFIFLFTYHFQPTLKKQ